MFKLAFLFAICIYLLNAQIPIPQTGSCVTSPVIADFDVSKYLGQWYEIERENVFFEENHKCIQAKYSSLNATAALVENFSIDTITGKPDNGKGYAMAPDTSKPNQLLAYFPNNPAGAEYNIWKTDYNTYSIVYSCKPVIPGLLKFEFIWILSKQQTLDESILQDLKAFLEKNNVNASKFKKNDLSGC